MRLGAFAIHLTGLIAPSTSVEATRARHGSHLDMLLATRLVLQLGKEAQDGLYKSDITDSELLTSKPHVIPACLDRPSGMASIANPMTIHCEIMDFFASKMCMRCLVKFRVPYSCDTSVSVDNVSSNHQGERDFIAAPSLHQTSCDLSYFNRCQKAFLICPAFRLLRYALPCSQ